MFRIILKELEPYKGRKAFINYYDMITERYYCTIGNESFIISGKTEEECELIFHQVVDMMDDPSTYVEDIKNKKKVPLKIKCISNSKFILHNTNWNEMMEGE